MKHALVTLAALSLLLGACADMDAAELGCEEHPPLSDCAQDAYNAHAPESCAVLACVARAELEHEAGRELVEAVDACWSHAPPELADAVRRCL